MRHHSVPPADGTGVGAEHDEDAMTRDDQTLAVLLVTVWAARTGRVLRPVPVYGAGMKGNLHALMRLAALKIPLPFGAISQEPST